MTAEEYRQRLNEHPLLKLPPEQRWGNTAMRINLANLLCEYFYSNELRKGLFDKLQNDNDGEDTADETEEATEKKAEDVKKSEKYTSLQLDEIYVRRALYNPRLRARTMDGVVFAEMFKSVLNSFQYGNGSFVNYFFAAYKNNFPHYVNGIVGIADGRPVGPYKEGDVRLLRNLRKLMEKLGREPNVLLIPPHEIDNFAKLLKTNPKNLHTLLEIERSIHNDTSLDDKKKGTDTVLGEVVADPTIPNDPVSGDNRVSEDQLKLMPIIIALASAEKSEMFRLLFTNQILAVLENLTKELNSNRISAEAKRLKERELKEYLGVLRQYEKVLYKVIFSMDYLRFLFEPPPEPDCLENLNIQRLRKPIRNKRIAEYRQCSESNISQVKDAYKKFWFGVLRKGRPVE